MKERILSYHKNLNEKYIDANSKHFEWVDICKGILIIFVVAGHASSLLAPYAYLFHIPLFFFLAGYVERLDEKSMLQIVWQKFVTLVIPYVMVNVIYLFLRVGLNLFRVQEFFYDDVLGREQLWEFILKIVKVQWISDLGGATWYLGCLFVTFLLAKIIVILSHNKINLLTVFIAFIFLAGGLIVNYLEISMRYYIDIALVAVFYLVLGSYCREKNILDNLTYISWKIWLVVLLIYCYFFSQRIHASVDWSAGNYNNPVLSMITILLAAVILMNLSKSIQNTWIGNLLTFYGKESLALMLLHFLCFKIIYVFLVAIKLYPADIMKNLLPPDDGIWNLLYIVGAILLFSGMHFLLQKVHIYRWFFEGKIRVPAKVKNGEFNRYSGFVATIVILAFIYIIPFHQIVRGIEKLNLPYQIEGVCYDNFIEEKMGITVETDEPVTIQFQLYNPFESENSCNVYLNGKYVAAYEIGKEVINVEVPVSEAGNHQINVEFENVYIPKELGVSEDIRKLTVILVDGKILLK